MSTDPTCGCCDGIAPVTPRPVYNRPGLPGLNTRVGTHADFFETMIARLTTHALPDGRQPLKRLSTRDPADPAIAFLDAWAILGDVLTFYQERIANEGYLGTAIHRRSILELGRLVGYELRPGVAASVYLSFTLESGYDVTVPAGSLARSLPGPGENAEPFETSEPLEARARWNALPPRKSRPFVLEPPAPGTDTLVKAYLAGADTGLSADQMVLVDPSLGGPTHPLVVRSVQADRDAGLTAVTLADTQALYTPPDVLMRSATVIGSPLSQLGSVIESVNQPPSSQPPSRYQLARDPQQTYGRAADLGPQLLASFNPTAKDALFAAYANAPVTVGSPYAAPVIAALRVSALPFGATAPLEFITLRNGTVERREWLLSETHSALAIAAQSTLPDGDGSIANIGAVFAHNIDLTAGEAAPLTLTLRIWDMMSRPRIGTVSLSDFGDSDTAPEDRIWTGDIDEVPVTLTAHYQGEASVWQLRSVTVQWTAPGGTAVRTTRFGRNIGSDIILSAPLLLAATPPLPNFSVSFDFLENAGQPPVVPGTDPIQLAGGDGSQATISLSPDAATLTVVRSESRFAGTPTARRILSLDAEYADIVPGSKIVVDGPMLGTQVFDVLDVRDTVRTDYGLSQKVTIVLVDRPWLTGAETSLADIRPLTVYGGNEMLDLAEKPLTDDVAGGTVELDGLYEGLKAGRWLAIGGERTDVQAADGTAVGGIMATELAMLANVAHRPARGTDTTGNAIDLPGETLHTLLSFAEPLAYRYKRDTATINANVVIASHGETKREVLGSGDSAARLQQFNLTAAPLTHVSAVTPKGTSSTLQVRVNDILWRAADSLAPLGPNDRRYQTRTDDDAKTTITFGNGRQGARLPSGTGNVTATYRAGIGVAGNVAGGKVSVLGPKPLGVKEVVNPVAASGGANAESRDQARRRLPLATRALDRLVSVEDYTDFATLYAGIDKALAARLPGFGREVVHLTLAGADDATLDPRSALWRNLSTSLTAFGDPGLPIVMAARETILVFLSARVRVLPDYLWETVEPVLRADLITHFGFAARALGQPMRLSEIVAVMQAIDGVDYVDVDLFDGVSATDAATPETLADKLAGFAQPETPMPRNYLPAAPARRDGDGLRPAQLIYLSSDLVDTLILTEVTT